MKYLKLCLFIQSRLLRKQFEIKELLKYVSDMDTNRTSNQISAFGTKWRDPVNWTEK